MPYNNDVNNNINNNQVTDIIIEASSYMDNSDFYTALNLINKGLSLSPNNYELNFMSTLCYEQNKEIEKAYYRYCLAIYLATRDVGDISDDTTLIKKSLIVCVKIPMLI